MLFCASIFILNYFVIQCVCWESSRLLHERHTLNLIKSRSVLSIHKYRSIFFYSWQFEKLIDEATRRTDFELLEQYLETEECENVSHKCSKQFVNKLDKLLCRVVSLLHENNLHCHCNSLKNILFIWLDLYQQMTWKTEIKSKNKISIWTVIRVAFENTKTSD